MQTDRRGFTLVELSIVLVILGLLIGGVLTGQSLIRAAELRSVTTQYSRYITAVQTFRDKYFALPGDMANATAYWGAADGSTGLTAGCATTVGTGTTTCNGNADGFLGAQTGTNEPFRFWQHLANAGLIEGNYTGVDTGTGSTSLNNPVGRISASLWFAGNMSTKTANTSIFDGVYNNVFEFGGLQPGSDPYRSILKPEDAYNIDTKLDDGKPGTGKVIARDSSGFSGVNCTTATASTMTSASYSLTTPQISCALLFPQVF